MQIEENKENGCFCQGSEFHRPTQYIFPFPFPSPRLCLSFSLIPPLTVTVTVTALRNQACLCQSCHTAFAGKCLSSATHRLCTQNTTVFSAYIGNGLCSSQVGYEFSRANRPQWIAPKTTFICVSVFFFPFFLCPLSMANSIRCEDDNKRAQRRRRKNNKNGLSMDKRFERFASIGKGQPLSSRSLFSSSFLLPFLLHFLSFHLHISTTSTKNKSKNDRRPI